MRAVDYAMRQAWASLWRSRASTLFAVVAIALGIVVLGALLLVTWNVERVLGQWSSAAEFSVYLRDDATSDQRGEVEALIDGSGVSAGRDYVSKADALNRFRRDFAELASLAEGLDDNPFPASIEVQVVPAAGADGRADDVVRRLAGMAGVADVRYDRAWIERISAGLGTIRWAGFGLAALMVIAAGVTVATVIRLSLYARRDELEIMELVGAPLLFIRGPFVAEGALQGGIGALLALALLYGAYTVGSLWWGSDLASVLDGARVEFLPARLAVGLVLGGMLVGAGGGFAAARHAG